MKQKRSFGQVFLNDKKYIKMILDALSVKKKNVLEIGPGKGQISEHLAESVSKLYCIEVDSRFCNYLEHKFADNPKVEIVHCDILKFPLSKLGENIVVFGNVPYQISSQLINYLIDYRGHIDKVYLTLQKEFVEKLIAKPSSSQFNFLSCYIQYYAKIKTIFDIPAKAFNPVPRVNSSFIELEFYKTLLNKAEDEELLFKIIRKAFSSRRKKIINSLPSLKSKQNLFSRLGINPVSRAENISLKQYVSIANKLYKDAQ